MARTSDSAGGHDPPDTADLIDRVLDRGIVIDAQYEVSVAGVHLMTVDMWLVTASLETYKGLLGTSAAETLGLTEPPWLRGPGARGAPGA